MARRRSLTVQISAFISVFIALLVGVIILLTGFQLSREIKDLVINDNRQIALARANELGEMMNKLTWQLRVMSSRPDLVGGERGVIEGFVQSQVSYISPEVVGLMYIWKNGDYVSSAKASGNVSDRDYCRALITDNKNETVGKAIISKSLNVPIIVTGVGIKGSDGTNAAALAFQFKLDKLSEIVGGIKVGTTGYGWIVDHEGMFIASPDPGAIMNSTVLDRDKDGYRGMDALGMRILSEESGSGAFATPDGVPMTTFFVSVPNTPGWKLGISMPTSEIDDTARRLILMVSVFALVAIAFATFIAIAFARSISRPIGVACASMGEFAKGDFTLANVDPAARMKLVARKDELGDLGRSLDVMAASLKTVVTHVIDAANQVSSGSEQLSASSQQISQGANMQASSVEELSASMEQMSSNIKQNAENAQKTEAIARKSAVSAETGGTAVLQTVSAMKQIAEKITIIEEIARSTNMLALNASIEAARAGEYGKGFAVVAAEVGKLAERSSRQAGEINSLSVSSLKIAEEAGATIANLVPEIRNTADLVQEISAASREQDSGAGQINSAILQLDQVVQQNASISEEAASMSEELAGQADSLKDTIGFFKISDDGADAPILLA